MHAAVALLSTDCGCIDMCASPKRSSNTGAQSANTETVIEADEVDLGPDRGMPFVIDRACFSDNRDSSARQTSRLQHDSKQQMTTCTCGGRERDIADCGVYSRATLAWCHGLPDSTYAGAAIRQVLLIGDRKMERHLRSA